jgi:hypothetical protein
MGKRVATASETGPAEGWQRRGVPLLFGFGTDGAEQNLLPWLAQNIAAVFTILLSIVLIALLAALVYALWRELRRNTIVLDPLEVPRELIERGYSPAVVTERMLNAVHTIQSVANTQKPRRGHIASALQADIQIPVGQLSIKAFAGYFRQLLDFPDQHVAGEITRDGDSFTLQLRRRDGQQATLGRSRTAADVGPLISAGAEEVVRLTDPYVLASYYIEQELPAPSFQDGRGPAACDRDAAGRSAVGPQPAGAAAAQSLRKRRGPKRIAAWVRRRSGASEPRVGEFMTALIRNGRTEEALRIADAAARGRSPRCSGRGSDGAT